MRDITKMLTALELSPTDFSVGYIDQQGTERISYELPPREVKILITGYDVVRRAKVIDRLEQLERNIIPQDLPTALRLYADQVEQRELAERKVALNLQDGGGRADFCNQRI
jgi:hypothetical protein